MKHGKKFLFCLLTFSLVFAAAVVLSSAQTENLAAIGNTEYETLAEAVAAAQDGDTVTVLANQTITNSVYIENKTVQIDLNGKRLVNEVPLFWIRSGGKLTIVGAGAISSAGDHIIRVEDNATDVEVTIGDGTNVIGINDNASTTGATLISAKYGKFTATKLEVDSTKKSSGKVVLFGHTEVTLDRCRITTYNTGAVALFSFEEDNALIRFYATDCIFDSQQTADDLSVKATAIHLPAYSEGTTAGPKPGSSFVMDGCTLNFKWRLFVQGGNNVYTNMDVVCNECKIYAGYVSSNDTAFARRINVYFNDCFFDDSNARGSSGEIIAMEGKAYFSNNTRVKYGTLIIEKSDVVECPDNFVCYYMRNDTTGYPYLYTGVPVSPSEVILLSTITRTGFSNVTIPQQSATSQFHNRILGGKIHVNAKAVAGDNLARAVIQTTENGSNRYMRFYAHQPTTVGRDDAYIDFIIDSDRTNIRYGFTEYAYFSFDFDIMTDTAYQDNLNCVVIGRDESGSSKLGGNSVFRIRTETAGEHKGETFFQSSVGDKAYVGRDAYEWYHITVLLRVEANEFGVLTGMSSNLYVNGERVNQTVYSGFIPNSCVYLGGFRFTYDKGANGTVANLNDAVCFDNVTLTAYQRVDTEAGYVDTLAPLFDDDPIRTLIETNYVAYNAQYELPEVAPVATAGGIFFQSFGDAYNSARINGYDITLIRNFTSTTDVESEIRIYTGGIEWVPTEGSWGFIRGEDPELGAYFQFSAALNAGVEVFWMSNPFDPDYAYIEIVKGGRRIAPPIADTNLDRLTTYAIRDGTGNYVFHRFLGWSLDPDAILPDEELPIVTAELISDALVMVYPVFEETDALYVIGNEKTVTLLSYDVDNDEDVECDYEIFFFGQTLADLQNALQSAENGDVFVLLDDLVLHTMTWMLTIPQDLSISFDLNGHTLGNLGMTKDESGKYGVFSLEEGSSLDVVSSVPGGTLYSRGLRLNNPNPNAGTGVFRVKNNATLTIKDENVLVRCVILIEAPQPCTIEIENITIDKLAGDSFALFMLRSTADISLSLKNVLILYTMNGMQEIFDVGGGQTTVSNVSISMEDCTVIVTRDNSQGTAPYIANRFPTGAQLSVTGTVGTYRMGNSNAIRGGVILCGAGNRFAFPVDPSQQPYENVQIAPGLVVARQWARVNVTDFYPDGYSYHSVYFAAESVSEWNDGELLLFSAHRTVRYGTYPEEQVADVVWHAETDLQSAVLHTEKWVLAEPNPFYSNAVPGGYTDETGAIWTYLPDAWVCFMTDGQGVRHYGPDGTQMILSGVFGIKQNIFLYADFRMNIYLPKIDAVIRVYVDEVELPSVVRVIDGREYLMITYTLGSHEAAKKVTYQITITEGGKTATQVISASVAHYARALITHEGGTYEDLAMAMLRYARAAFLCSADEGDPVPSILQVDEAAEHAPSPAAVNTMPTSGPIIGLSLNLGPKPIFVLMLDGTCEGVVSLSYVDTHGALLTISKEATAGDTMIGFEEIRLYDLSATLTVRYAGEEIGTYNLTAFAETVTDYPAGEAALVTLFDYIAAAKEYILNR